MAFVLSETQRIDILIFLVYMEIKQGIMKIFDTAPTQERTDLLFSSRFIKNVFILKHFFIENAVLPYFGNKRRYPIYPNKKIPYSIVYKCYITCFLSHG